MGVQLCYLVLEFLLISQRYKSVYIKKLKNKEFTKSPKTVLILNHLANEFKIQFYSAANTVLNDCGLQKTIHMK